MSKKIKKSIGKLNLQLNQIKSSELNPTLKEASFVVADVELSGNNQIIAKDTLSEAIKQINHLPILAKYFPVTSGGESDDNFGDHEPFINTDRDGNDFIDTDTIPIGHFISEGRYEEINGIIVVVADAVLYADKFPNQIDLLQELLDSGIKINTSCEYYYSKKDSEIIDGVEYIGGNIVFIGHTILGSNPDGFNGVIDGAYESSEMISMNKKIEWNKSLNMIISEQNRSNNIENKTKEGDNMKIFEKIMNAMSHDDIKSKLYSQLESILSLNDWYDSYINEVYEDRLILKVWGTSYADSKYYEFSYSKDENSVTIDPESKKEVVRDWVEVQSELITTQNKLTETENLLTATKESLIVESHNKKQIEEKLDETTAKILQMNEKLESLSEVEKEFNALEKEKALNERKAEFEPKFKKVNALEVFNSEEVQTMILNSLEDENIKASLNSMIIDLIPEIKEELVKSENSKKEDLVNGLVKNVNNLIPTENKNKNILSNYITED